MPLNSPAMIVLANKLRTEMLLYGQLHSDFAGVDYTSNIAVATRKAPTWTAATGLGDFDLSTEMLFTGGSGPVKSITFWTAPTSGTCYGEFVFNASSDPAFSSTGAFSVTSIDFAGGTAEGSGS